MDTGECIAARGERASVEWDGAGRGGVGCERRDAAGEGVDWVVGGFAGAADSGGDVGVSSDGTAAETAVALWLRRGRRVQVGFMVPFFRRLFLWWRWREVAG